MKEFDINAGHVKRVLAKYAEPEEMRAMGDGNIDTFCEQSAAVLATPKQTGRGTPGR